MAACGGNPVWRSGGLAGANFCHPNDSMLFAFGHTFDNETIEGLTG